jgi:hypothetical protein
LRLHQYPASWFWSTPQWAAAWRNLHRSIKLGKIKLSQKSCASNHSRRPSTTAHACSFFLGGRSLNLSMKACTLASCRRLEYSCSSIMRNSTSQASKRARCRLTVAYTNSLCLGGRRENWRMNA